MVEIGGKRLENFHLREIRKELKMKNEKIENEEEIDEEEEGRK